MDNIVLERFLRYVKVDTESAYNRQSVPSTEKQKDLAAMIVGELKALGVNEAFFLRFRLRIRQDSRKRRRRCPSDWIQLSS